MVADVPNLISSKSLCFVIWPIGKDGSSERKHADLLLNAVIKQVLQQEEFGYSVKRADEDADPGMIGDRVITDIINAELVIADLTELNPNAFYELGIRHSTEKPTIHVARTNTALPFDNISHRTIFVDLTAWQSTEQARNRLAEAIRATKAIVFRVSNPITQANASFKMRESEDPRDRIIAEMNERLAVVENSIMRAQHSNTFLSPIEGSSRGDRLDQLAKIAKELLGAGTPPPEVEETLYRYAKDRGINIRSIRIDNRSLYIESDKRLMKLNLSEFKTRE